MESFRPLPAAANCNDLVTVRQILLDGRCTQGDLDVALARAVLRFNERRAIAELLVAHGADPNGQYGSDYGPLVFVTSECLDPDGLQFLIDHGADVMLTPVITKYGGATPMSHALGSYVRGQNDRKHRCVSILLDHHAVIPPEISPPMLAIHRGDVGGLAELLDSDPLLLTRRFSDMPFGNILLRGGSLLHMTVEFGEVECLDLLLARGADFNLTAEVLDGIGGQTPIFHAIATCQGANLPILEYLLRRFGQQIDMSVRATFRLLDGLQSEPVTPLEYACLALGASVPDWRRACEREIELLESAML